MNYKTLKPDIRGRFDEVEKKFFNQSSSLRTSPEKEKIEFSKYCWDESEKITDLIIKDISKINFTVKNGPFKNMWDTFNKEANFQI